MVSAKKGVKRMKTITPSIVIGEDLWTKLRMQSIREKKSASEIIRRLVSDYLRKAAKGGNK